MSNRRAQDERIEGTPDGVNAISEIVDVPDAPTIGTATAGIGNASVAFTPATTGGTVSLFTATSNPDSITGTSATSPITVSGLTGGTAYTFTVRGANSTGTGPSSSASNSVTPVDLPGAYDALADITVTSGGASVVSLVGIPQDYKHLQLRIFGRGLSSSADRVSITVKVNSDTGNNYANHALIGDGSSASAAAATSQGVGANNYMAGISAIVGSTGAANAFGASIVDLLDYSSTSKYKTFRSLTGQDQNNTSGRIALVSGLWQNTAAITSLDLNLESGSWAQYSNIALYGVK